MDKQIQKLMRVCPICNCRTGYKLLDLNFEKQEGNPLPTHYEVVACEECGFTYSDMNASQLVFNEYYSDFNAYAVAESIRIKDAVQDTRFIYLVNMIEKYVPSSATILDVGCGGGELLQALKQKGYDKICGLDPSAEAIKKLSENGIRGILANIFDEKNIDEQFDVVVSTAVAEHIFDLNSYVNNLSCYIKKNGFIVINVPAVENFPEKMAFLAANFNQEHINFFSKATLDNLFIAHGFVRCNADPYMVDGNDKQLITVYKRQNGGRDEIKYDVFSERHIRSYLERYETIQNENDEKIRYILSQANSLVVFGVGSYAMQLLKRFSELLDKTLFFIDNNSSKQGMLLSGREVKSVEALKELKAETAILVCSMCNSKDIKKQIEALGIKNRIFSI